jgi:hypothetical protein
LFADHNRGIKCTCFDRQRYTFLENPSWECNNRCYAGCVD